MDLIPILEKYPMLGGGILISYLALAIGFLRLKWEIAQMRKELTDTKNIMKSFSTVESMAKEFKLFREIIDTKLEAMEKIIERATNNAK